MITKDIHGNAIFSLIVYRYGSAWVFDDPDRGIVKEALVCGIDCMLDTLTANVPYAKLGVMIQFSDNPFPSQDIKLERVTFEKEKGKGTWYWSDTLNEYGWLCSVLYQYFEDAPTYLYVSIKPIEHPWYKRILGWMKGWA